MTRTLEALKLLESRVVDEAVAARRKAAHPIESEASAVPSTIAPLQKQSICSLPIRDDVSKPYLDLASRISEQLAANYSNVVMFAAADHAAEANFSMAEVAQAFSQQSPGNVLLVDGDLRRGRLSKSACPGGQGIIEAMLGTATWAEITHHTNIPGVDFVPSGKAQIPTLERSEFGWSALRPKYRAVLIGVGMAGEPEINWLAARCDAVYFVISRPHTKRLDATAAVNALRASGANVLGCVVVND